MEVFLCYGGWVLAAVQVAYWAWYALDRRAARCLLDDYDQESR